MRTKIQQKPLLSQKGFTLLGIIAVLAIVGVLAAVIVPRFIDLETGAKQRSIDTAIGELNGREHLTWGDQKISITGYVDDATVHSAIDYLLGSDYTWDPGDPTESGGTLNFKGVGIELIRVVSESDKPANWKRVP
jgi:prepilin-type N-terminal cleavage/methylation domain-containing protein